MNDVNNNMTDGQAVSAVIGIAEEAGGLKAVLLRKKGTAFEILWKKSSDLEQANPQSLLAGLPEVGEEGDMPPVAVGFDSNSVLFYRVNVPLVPEKELEAMVRLQSEARLPLPAERMELTWRAGRADGGQIAVTIAAAKKEHLQKFVEKVRGFKPVRLGLNYEGIVKAWQRVFSGGAERAVVLSVEENLIRVCLVEEGLLGNAVSLDVGFGDLAADENDTVAKFIQDMRSVLELFGAGALPIFVLSDGSSELGRIVDYLKGEGFDAEAALPEMERLVWQDELSAKDIYEYRSAIGAAVMELESEGNELDIFKGLYRPVRKKGGRWWHSLKLTAAAAIAMLVLLVIVFYVVDVVSLHVIEKKMNESENGVNCQLLVKRQKLVKKVAVGRIDLLKLFGKIGEGENKGILLDSFEFKKGRAIAIRGQTDNADKLYKFQENLLDRKGISDVKINSTKKSDKGGKLKFNMSFHYKNFTKRKR